MKKHVLFGVPLYHGTAREFGDFSLDFVGSEKSSDWGKGIYFTRSKGNADYYRLDAVKNADPELDKLFKDYNKHTKANRKGNTLNPEAEPENNRLYEKFRARADELNQSQKGRIIVRYLAPSAKILQHRHHPGCITDQTLAEHARDKGYDAILIDKGYWTEEVIVMNLNKLLPYNPRITTKRALKRIPIRRKDGVVQNYHIKRLTR